MKCFTILRYKIKSSVVSRDKPVNSFLMNPLKTCKRMLYLRISNIMFHSFINIYSTNLLAPKLLTVLRKWVKSIVSMKFCLVWIQISKNDVIFTEESNLTSRAAKFWCFSVDSLGKRVERRSKRVLQTLIIYMLFWLLSYMRKEFIFLAKSYARSARSPNSTNQLTKPCNLP
jgi:hypothetical protein